MEGRSPSFHKQTDLLLSGESPTESRKACKSLTPSSYPHEVDRGRGARAAALPSHHPGPWVQHGPLLSIPKAPPWPPFRSSLRPFSFLPFFPLQLLGLWRPWRFPGSYPSLGCQPPLLPLLTRGLQGGRSAPQGSLNKLQTFHPSFRRAQLPPLLLCFLLPALHVQTPVCLPLGEGRSQEVEHEGAVGHPIPHR